MIQANLRQEPLKPHTVYSGTPALSQIIVNHQNPILPPTESHGTVG